MSLAGHLLIAPAHMTDPNFAETVLLLVRHDAEGAFGLVLNRPTNQFLADLWAKVHGGPCPEGVPLRAGGPVPGPLVALHQEADLGDFEVVPGVWCTVADKHIKPLISRAPEPLRVFVGYSGWGAGQLEGELNAGSWLTAEAEAKELFQADEQALWGQAVRRATRMQGWGNHGTPETDPRLN